MIAQFLLSLAMRSEPILDEDLDNLGIELVCSLIVSICLLEV